MPTYQYTCTECGESLEVVQKFSDDSLTECPACEGRLRKIFSPAAIVFRGSGFYRTDSRSGSGAASSAPKETAKKDETKSETKTETKKESKTESSSSSSSKSSKNGSSSEKVA
ncbi:FmdB family zinc ribbon protein [Actinomadura sp. DC4]|uniref:FmdB family zinc ribbon protein n=1 Tax=Actinomadura sp. DC4 TaxID=3055069 RepID=UPI0025AF8EA1|nr:FmdB family zinc ribbon protein [Actinomadura sp. DC4]MDN3352412.1 zinc ribbon domain-containing protein [Actinomadura sp. DC4]